MKANEEVQAGTLRSLTKNCEDMKNKIWALENPDEAAKRAAKKEAGSKKKKDKAPKDNAAKDKKGQGGQEEVQA